MGVRAAENLRAGLVSIGLPVYNGARYLRSALDSLVSQDYEDFEVIISDNASDDDTESICREYADRDPRVRYYRAERNMGPVLNAVRVYELARGEYFMLAAHDDLRHPQYLRRCVDELKRNPQALFCCTGTNFIDADGLDITDTFAVRSLRPIGATGRERLRALARSTFWLDIYSLIRTTALQDTMFGQELWGGDILIVSALCLRGEVVEVPERLFTYRCFFEKTAEDIAHTINPAGRLSVSWLGLTLEMLKNIWSAPIRVTEKIGSSLMFIVEFCVRNRTVNGYIHEEGFRGVRHALANGRLSRAVAIAALGVVIVPTTYIRRLITSLRYRLGRGKTVWSSQDTAPGAK